MSTTISRTDVRNLFLGQRMLEKELGVLKHIITTSFGDELSPKTLRKAEKTSRLLDKNGGEKFRSAMAFNKYLKELKAKKKITCKMLRRELRN